MTDTMFKEVVQGMKKNGRWATAFAKVADKLTKIERQKRGEMIRQIKSHCPQFQEAEALSLYDLEDVIRGQERLMMSRLCVSVRK